MENIQTIEDCCKIIKAQNKLLAKYIGNDEHLFIITLDKLANRILELHKKELAKNNKPTYKDLVFIKPFRKEKIIINHFHLNFVFKNKRTVIYENQNMRFSFDKKVIRVLIYDGNDVKLIRKVQDYFYEKQWRKK